MVTAVRFRAGSAVAAGVIGGVVFAVFEMLASALLMGPEALFMPLRMIGAIALGPQALEPGYSLLAAGSAGLIVHMVLSIAFALVFAALASPLSTSAAMLMAGMAFGTVLWIVNFYVVAPLAGWAWFPEEANPIVQFLAHAFFFGCPVGAYLASRRQMVPAPPA